jgi:exopolysaccharide biosynthesis polyprenyl glycosylphosphotransferase
VQSGHALTGTRSEIQPIRRDATSERLRIVRRFGQIISDGVLVWLAFWVAYQLRYKYEFGGTILFFDREPFSTYYGMSALFVGATLLAFIMRGLYRLPRWFGFLDEATLVAGGVTTSMATVILLAFLFRFSPSRLVFLYAWICAVLFLLARRLLSRTAKHWLWSKGIGVDRVLVVGAGETGRRLMQAMMSKPLLGYQVVGFVDDGISADALAVATEHRVTRAERLGTTDEIGDVVQSRQIDEVIIALSGDEHERVLSIIEHCRRRSVTFKVVPDLLQLSLDRIDIGEVAGVPLIGLKDASIRGLNYMIKRSIDIVIATLVLAIVAIPMGIIALLVKRDSAGPVFYRAPRIGKNGVPFTLIKFRCMVDGADELRADLVAEHGDVQDPRLFKLPDDPRLTGIGRVLRRWSLDELPQFVNILKGDMSVVGPRPQLPDEVAKYEDWHRQRLLVTPGLTGLWQINGRSKLSFDEMVRLDLYYAEHWSPWLDLKIVLRTAPAVATGRGAY